jgi:hypothetical protein
MGAHRARMIGQRKEKGILTVQDLEVSLLLLPCSGAFDHGHPLLPGSTTRG